MVNSFRASTAAAIGGLIALIGLGVPTVLAHQGASSQPAAAGTVQAVNSSSTVPNCGTAGSPGSFTVLLKKGGTETVDVTTTTTFSEPGVSSQTFADLCVGDWAAAAGTTAGSTVTATQVWFSAPRVSGSVLSVDGGTTPGTSCGVADSGGTFTVQGWKTSSPVWTVAVGVGTTFYEWGVSPATFADLCVGDSAGATGTLTGLDALTATKVRISSTRVSGSVLSVNGATTPGTSCGSAGSAGSFTVQGWKSSSAVWTVTVGSGTTFTEGKKSSASFANVCVGVWVAAAGTTSGGTLAATSVVIRETGSQTPGSRSAGGHPQWTKNQSSASAQSQVSSGAAKTWQGDPDGAAPDARTTSGGGGWGHGRGSGGPAGGSGRGGR
jgi:hypothetical protein